MQQKLEQSIATPINGDDSTQRSGDDTFGCTQELSLVGNMFEGRSIFVTGASGFIGRVLLEKLLRSYSGIKRIYILMRAKKNQQPYERLHKQLLKVPIFDAIRSMKDGEERLAKIIVIAGDIAEPRLGISDADMKTLLEDETLSIVFHSAATIKFDEPLKVSVNLNLIATRTIIGICRKLPNLIALCHVSTAYVNSDLKNNQPIEEKLYPMRDDPEHLIKMANLMDEDLMQTLKVKLVGQRPNTYTYTKALAEHLIANEASDLPVIILRPSIVVASWREPLPGWIDNLNGPTGLILAIGKGLLRTMHVSRQVTADVIPVDVVVNTMIASAYYAAKIHNKLGPIEDRLKSSEVVPLKIANGETNEQDIKQVKRTTTTTTATTTSTSSIQSNESRAKELKDKVNLHANGLEQKVKMTNGLEASSSSGSSNGDTSKTTPPIIHCNSGHLNPITWGKMEDMFFPIIRNYPSCQVLRYPFGSFKGNRYYDLLTRIFVHYLPAMLIDLLCLFMGKKRQLLSIYNKLHSATAALSHFCTTNYNFRTNNIKLVEASLNDIDKRELYMDIEQLDWYKFWDVYVLGARRFVLKEADHTLPEARKSFLRAYYLEIALRALLLVMLSTCCLFIFTRFQLTTSSPLHKTLKALNLCV